MFGLFKNKEEKAFVPTQKDDSIAYAAGGKSTYLPVYNTYLTSVEALDLTIRTISNIAAKAEFKVEKLVGKELKPLKVKNVDFEYNVNDLDSQGEFIRKYFVSMLTQSAATIIAEENSKTKFINFFSYDPSRFRIDATENNIIDKFIYRSESGREIDFKSEDIIYVVNSLDMSNLVYGTSRLKAMNDLLLLQSNIMTQQNNYYASGGKDSAIISPKDPMSVDKVTALKTTFDQFLQTTSTKALFVNTELDVKSLSNSQTATQIMEALTKINNAIVGAFGLPKWLVGDFDGYVNDKAITTASRLFFQTQMKPMFDMLAYQMTRYFRNTLGIANARISFDYTNIEILEDSLKDKIDNAATLYKLGILSLNEARVISELEPIDSPTADKHFLPAYLVSNQPVSVEDYEELKDSILSTTTQDLPSGSSGGQDNEQLI